MPYTFAHIGYILPVKNKWPRYFSSTGLVFGSLAPDYDILFRLTSIRFHLFQYDLATIFFIIYPLAFISACAFHYFCRNILIHHLPSHFSHKYGPYLHNTFFDHLKTHFFKISFSILFAIMLHLFLDYLCHILDAASVQSFVYILSRNEGIAQFSYGASIYLLPVLFSLAGFYLIYKYELKEELMIRNFSISKKHIPFWIAVGMLTLFISGLKLAFTKREEYFLLDFIAISVTSSFMVSVYTSCFLFFIKTKKQQKKAIQ